MSRRYWINGARIGTTSLTSECIRSSSSNEASERIGPDYERRRASLKPRLRMEETAL